MVLPSRPKVHRRWLVAGDGGTAELRRGVLTTASPCCLIRARYELHEGTKELSKLRGEDEEVSVVGGRGEVTGAAMAAVAGMVTATLPKLEWLG